MRELEKAIEKEKRSVTMKRSIAKIIDVSKHTCMDMGIDEIEVAEIQGLAVAGWAAWTIFDRIKDDARRPLASDLAIFCSLRSETERRIQMLDMDEGYRNKAQKILDTMEWADASPCRLNIENRSILKSIGVSLPMICALMSADVEKKYIIRCHRFFYHLIGARQFSDDALDWPEDMKKGHKTLVTQWLEETVGENRSLREYRKGFETIISPRVAQKILDHSRESIGYARKMTCFKSTEFLEELPRFYKDMATNILRGYGS